MKNNDLASYYFHQGTNFNSYDYLGCSIKKEGNGFIYAFRVWAPNADRVFLVSDKFGWSTGIEMKRITEKGIYELIYKSTDDLIGSSYKYRIVKDTRSILKGDPYAKASFGGDDGASLIYRESFIWDDYAWMKKRKKEKGDKLSGPINIYEMHLGSFIRHKDGTYLSYREIADVIIPYIKYMGYTHVEFMPIMEHPFDGSWGYQVCGFFAPTSRFGTPDDLKFLINELHRNFIGVILDFVPAHFPKDEWGLYEFDSKPLYEFQGDDRKESRSWGTRYFDLGREEVQSFLISAVMYYLREYHVDGIRFDAVASILYLDYDKNDGEWVKNSYGGKESLEGIAFLKKMNTAIRDEFPDVLTIAEESGDLNGVTINTDEGGLGFDMKWNMGFANDFFKYMSIDPIYRKYSHKALNFPILYAFNERYILPISHDEVVHGKKSFINKMHGEYSEKFDQMRCALLFIMTFPGKKSLFMGTEFAQFREWDYDSMLEWFMLDFEKHNSMREYVSALNRFYLEHRELYELDFVNEGFEWILSDESDKNSVAFKRYSRDKEYLMVIINFSGAKQTLDIEATGLKEIFSTGKNAIYNRDNITLEPFSGVILKDSSIRISIKDIL